MTILKQNSKIILTLPDSVYKQPPVIDISSDYGVTKDVSNLVSSVKNRNNSNVFRSQAGKEPFENGNGFIFTGTDILNINTNWTPDFEKGVTFELDFHRNNTTHTGSIISSWYADNVTTREWLIYSVSTNLRFAFYDESDVIHEFVANRTSLTFSRCNIIIKKVGTNLVCVFDILDELGESIQISSIPYVQIKIDKRNKIAIGSVLEGIVPITFEGNINSIKVYDFDKRKIESYL